MAPNENEYTGFIANRKDRIQGHFKDLKLQFSSTKSIDKKTYRTRATSKFIVYSPILH